MMLEVVASRHLFQLRHRHRGRIADDAAFGPANGMFTSAHFHVIHAASALNLLQRHVEIEADAALGGPRDVFVQHAVAV